MASRESYGKENLKQLIQKVGWKAVQIDFTMGFNFNTKWLKSGPHHCRTSLLQPTFHLRVKTKMHSLTQSLFFSVPTILYSVS